MFALFAQREGYRWARWLSLGVWLTACSTPTPAPTLPPPATATQSPSPTVTLPTAAPIATTTPLPPASATAAPTQLSASPTPAGSTASPTPHPAAAVVFAYLEARAKADMTLATSLVCASYRSQAATEVVSFRSMNAQLEGVACAVAGENPTGTLVSCTGMMITTYGRETREWDLSSFVYLAVQEEATWKMCGYE